MGRSRTPGYDILSVRVRSELRRAVEAKADALGLRVPDLHRVALAALATAGDPLNTTDAVGAALKAGATRGE